MNQNGSSWQEAFMDAVMECDAEQLQRKINEAEMAISNRMKGVAVDSQEYLDMRAAVASLRRL
jgi:hypothetical protein